MSDEWTKMPLDKVEALIESTNWFHQYYLWTRRQRMATERFSREGLKKAMVRALRDRGWNDLADGLAAERDVSTTSTCAAAALDYLDRFRIDQSACDPDLMFVRAKPATNPALDSARARVAEAQAKLAEAQRELDRAKG